MEGYQKRHGGTSGVVPVNGRERSRVREKATVPPEIRAAYNQEKRDGRQEAIEEMENHMRSWEFRQKLRGGDAGGDDKRAFGGICQL